MKHITAIFLFFALGIGCAAQFQALEPTLNSIADCAGAKLVNHISEQGRDQIDSLYYLYSRTYTLPYASKKERAAVNKLISRIVEAYDKDIPASSGGFCYNVLPAKPFSRIESSTVSIYYSETRKPLVIGGVGKNYVTLRVNDRQNPKYRTVIGAEWWYGFPTLPNRSQAYVDKACRVVSIRLFKAFAPMEKPEKPAANVFAQAYSSFSPVLADTTLDTTPWRENVIKEIQFLGKMYRDIDDEVDCSIIDLINQRIQTYLLSTDITKQWYIRLFETLDQIPGYYVEIALKDRRLGCSFGQLAKEHDKYKNVFCRTWSTRGAPTCSGYGNASKNFLYQIVLENE